MRKRLGVSLLSSVAVYKEFKDDVGGYVIGDVLCKGERGRERSYPGVAKDGIVNIARPEEVGTGG